MTFISNIGSIINASKNKAPADQLIVVAKDDDNKVHNYFFACDNFWDSRSCYSQIVLGFPKENHEKISYWTNYQDGLIYVYMGTDFAKETVRNDVFYDIKQAHKPFFIGTVSNVSEETDQISVIVSNIGKRFKTQIPDEFRQKYINNQNVRDAFQAICEFLGVYYICPPNVAPENGNQDPDGDKNNPKSKTESEQDTAKQLSKQANDKNQNSNDKNNENENTNTEQENQNTVQNAVRQGYYQIAFDGNGAITFNNTAIESSFNSEESLLSMTDKTYDNFLKEGKEVLKDITKFLNGEAFDEIHPFYLDYNAITVEPKSSSTTNPEKLNSDPDTAKSMKKTQASSKSTSESLATKGAVKSSQESTASRVGISSEQLTYSQTAGQTSVKSPTNIRIK